MKRHKQAYAIAAMAALVLTLVDLYISVRILLSYNFANDKIVKGGLEAVCVYTFGNTGWNMNSTVCANLQPMIGKHHFQKSVLRMRNRSNVTIYIHDPYRDFISNALYRKRFPGDKEVQIIYKHIRHDNNIAFIDIGANIGVIALQIAKIGRRVIALEASYDCAQRLCASINEGSFHDNITLIHNAISSDHDDINFVLTKSGDYGISFVDREDVRNVMTKSFGNDTFQNTTSSIKAVTLDDFLVFPNFREKFKKVFIKIDIEGMEHYALEGAHLFFDDMDVTGVYMEWDKHRNKETADVIIDKMTSWNFVPVDCDSVVNDILMNIDSSCKETNTSESNIWPTNILWLPKQ